MRFRGGGVGHKATREASDRFNEDRDPLDINVGNLADELELDLDLEAFADSEDTQADDSHSDSLEDNRDSSTTTGSDSQPDEDHFAEL